MEEKVCCRYKILKANSCCVKPKPRPTEEKHNSGSQRTNIP